MTANVFKIIHIWKLNSGNSYLITWNLLKQKKRKKSVKNGMNNFVSRIFQRVILPSWLKAESAILNCQNLHENTTWNSLYTRANQRSLGQTADFWWFSVLSEFLTKIITGASVHSTQVMACKIQPVSLVSIYIT